MNIDRALFLVLSADAGVVALFGSPPRIYPNRLPEKPVLPAVSYRVLDTERIHHYGGPSGLAFPQYEFVAWGARNDLARQAETVLRNAIDGFPLDGGEGTVTDPDDASTLLINGILYSAGGGMVYDDEIKAWGVEALYHVMHNE